MSQITLGALSTLNLSTQVDPMFSEIYGAFTFAGTRVGVGGTPSAGSTFEAVGVQMSLRATAGNPAIIEVAGNGGTVGTNSIALGQTNAGVGYIVNRANTALIFGTNSLEGGRFDANNNLILVLQGAAPSLTVNGQMVFALTSSTNLRITVRGADGTTRHADITLA